MPGSPRLLHMVVVAGLAIAGCVAVPHWGHRRVEETPGAQRGPRPKITAVSSLDDSRAWATAKAALTRMGFSEEEGGAEFVITMWSQEDNAWISYPSGLLTVFSAGLIPGYLGNHRYFYEMAYYQEGILIRHARVETGYRVFGHLSLLLLGGRIGPPNAAGERLGMDPLLGFLSDVQEDLKQPVELRFSNVVILRNGRRFYRARVRRNGDSTRIETTEGIEEQVPSDSIEEVRTLAREPLKP